jgi:hypothetical protein
MDEKPVLRSRDVRTRASSRPGASSGILAVVVTDCMGWRSRIRGAGDIDHLALTLGE